MHGAQTQGGVCPHKVGLAIASHQTISCRISIDAVRNAETCAGSSRRCSSVMVLVDTSTAPGIKVSSASMRSHASCQQSAPSHPLRITRVDARGLPSRYAVPRRGYD